MPVPDHADTSGDESRFATPLLDKGLPRLAYRFRPSPNVRFDLENGGRADGTLRIEDYEQERVVGKETNYDALTYLHDLGDNVRESVLNQYHVVELPPLRDVLQDLQRRSSSPLRRLLDTLDISAETQHSIITALIEANNAIASTEAFHALAESITSAYEQLIGDINPLSVTLGFAGKAFGSGNHGLRGIKNGYSLKRSQASNRFALECA